MEINVFKIKNIIADLRSYICTDYCTNPKEIYEQIKKYEDILKEHNQNIHTCQRDLT